MTEDIRKNTVPKSITRMKEEFGGLSLKYIIIYFITVGISLALALSILLIPNMIIRAILMVIIFIIIVIFALFMRSPSVMDRSWLMYLFTIKSIRGENIVSKFTLPAAFLEKIIPLKQIHEKGLIEFTNNQYGLLLNSEPSRISNDELDSHIRKVVTLINSLHDELLMKIIVYSINKKGIKILGKNIIDVVNLNNKTKEQKKHLHSIYDKIQNNTDPTIQWGFYIFLYLGTHETLNKAIAAMNTYSPKFEEKLHTTGAKVIQLKDKGSIAMIYRQCINP